MFVPTDDGRWVDEHFARLAEIIRDYDPYLELRWIPPEYRITQEDRTRPYCVVDTRTNYIAMFASERDTPTDILSKLFDIDNANGDVLRRAEARDTAKRAIQYKEEMDRREEAQDFAAFALKTRKNYWKHKGVKYDDKMRRIE